MSIQYSFTGPHIHSTESIPKTMWSIVAALLPAAVAAFLFFGSKALYPIAGTALFSVLFEIPFAPGKFSRKMPLGDGSAFVAGLILGLSLSPGTSWWIPPVGALILVILGKHAFGGIGNNIFNPALVARAILLLSWPKHVTGWISPIDGLTAATPLGGGESDYLSLFLGNVPGSLGETSALAILLGAAFLILRGLVSWKVPLAVVTGSLAAALLFGADPLFMILSGSLLFGAVFMATDMVTSPTGKTSHLLYGFGCGFLTVFIRVFTVYPEGITFAFLFMNGLSYLMDRIGADPIFGQVQERNRRLFRVAGAALSVTVVIATAGATFAVTAFAGDSYSDAALGRSVRSLFPEANRIVAMESFDPGVQRYRVYEERSFLGIFAETSVKGYGGAVKAAASLSTEGRITAVHIASHRESATLGSRIAQKQFLSQFEGYHQDNRDEISSNIEVISGATVSSRALFSALENILRAGDKSATHTASSGAPLPPASDGTYDGTGQGYHGPIQVRVTISGGAVTAIDVNSHSETTGVGTRAMETLAGRIKDLQTLNPDSVSGATGTSRGFLNAVRNALEED